MAQGNTSITLSDTQLPQFSQFTANLANAASGGGLTYDLCTSSIGDVFIESISIYMVTAGATFTSISIQTNQTTPQIILSSTDGAVANLLAQKQIFNSIGGWDQSKGPIILRSGQKIQYTIIGATGSGSALITIKYFPVTAGSRLT